MKYSATILIVDEQGNTMHERELTPDEIIEELLTPPESDRGRTYRSAGPGRKAEARQEESERVGGKEDESEYVRKV